MPQGVGHQLVDGQPASVAATFTTNRMAAAPVLMDREHLAATDPAGAGRRGRVAEIMPGGLLSRNSEIGM